MKTLYFTCELKTDVILNVKSASEGNNQTLDFIPGNVFLGVVAGRLYQNQDNGKNALMFHSGKVRFGDAHPLVNGCRSLRVPSEFFMDKIKKEEGCLYVHCHMTDENHKELRTNGIQLKQCRTGFYVFENYQIVSYDAKKSFAIKSAHNRENLTSKDEAMYGYESLRKGAKFAFTVEVDEESLANSISDILIGVHHIGRSRTAQYGLVEIAEQQFTEQISDLEPNALTTVYADGRLIFLDEAGLPTYQPSLENLGLESGEICWDLSQIRTFQYAPWNFKRQAFDADRCGIEKGSVIVVRNAKIKDPSVHYVGSYRGEGFGKVIYNPTFLNAGEKGVSHLSFPEKPKNESKDKKAFTGDTATPLLAFLSCKKKESIMMGEMYELVNSFYKANQKVFKDAQFASQWGTIRSLAMQYGDELELRGRLFAKPNGYLVHGVAEDKWGERGRLKLLSGACDEAGRKGIALNLFLINLASQMQKLYRNSK